MTASVISVGILEDDDILRDYIVSIIEAETALQLRFAATTVAEAMQALDEGLVPDVCLVDLQLPDGSGTELVERLTKEGRSKALTLTMRGDRHSVQAALESGANGYLLKDSEPEMIIRHIRETACGAAPMSAQVTPHLLSMIRNKDVKPPAPADTKAGEPGQDTPLTQRETELLTLFAKGLSQIEAAELMDISPNTVRHYSKAIHRKLNVKSKSEAVFEAIQMGWIII